MCTLYSPVHTFTWTICRSKNWDNYNILHYLVYMCYEYGYPPSSILHLSTVNKCGYYWLHSNPKFFLGLSWFILMYTSDINKNSSFYYLSRVLSLTVIVFRVLQHVISTSTLVLSPISISIGSRKIFYHKPLPSLAQGKSLVTRLYFH